MSNKPKSAEDACALLRDCSIMDDTIVERLRATVAVSLEWADQTLDALIQLDRDIEAYSTKGQQKASPLSSDAVGMPLSDSDETTPETEPSVQHLRDSVRNIMMSMQNQDVIGQSVERASSALDRRAAILERFLEGFDRNYLSKNEIAEIHHNYCAEDNLHY